MSHAQEHLYARSKVGTTPTAPGPTKMPEGMGLKDLLAQVMGQQRDAEVTREKRKTLARADASGMPQVDRDRLRREILEWEAVAEYDSKLLVAVEETDVCEHCAGTSAHFIGLYVLQQNRRNASDRRFVLWEPQAVTPAIAHLTRALHTTERSVPFCPACVWNAGFALKYDGDLKP